MQSTIVKDEGTDFITDQILDHKFNCWLCGYKSNEETAGLNHYISCKNNSIKKECCDTEDVNLFDGHSSIKLELDVKEEEIELEEPTISGSFTPSRELKYVKLETPNELLKCSICNYETTQPILLQYHQKVHKGMVKRGIKRVKSCKRNKLFKCSFCDYASVNSSNFKVHMRSHTGQKPFKCSICDYSSTTSSYMKIHMRRHMGHRPYKCTICNFSSTTSGYMKVHMRRHTGHKPYKCTLCDFSSAAPGKINGHMRRKHYCDA